MANTSDIRNGLCIKHNHDLWKVVDFQHVKPGKGNAFVRTKLKSLTSGKVLDNTFPAGTKIEEIRVENRDYQYLYKDDTGLHFMNVQDYEQINLPEATVSSADLMKEGDVVDILFDADEERPLTVELPQHVEMEISYTEPGVKGDTATNTLKPATVETGAEIKVPLFCNTGDKIKVDTVNRSYVERIKS